MGNSVTVVTVGGAGGLGLKKLVARVARRGEKLQQGIGKSVVTSDYDAEALRQTLSLV